MFSMLYYIILYYIFTILHCIIYSLCYTKLYYILYRTISYTLIFKYILLTFIFRNVVLETFTRKIDNRYNNTILEIFERKSLTRHNLPLKVLKEKKKRDTLVKIFFEFVRVIWSSGCRRYAYHDQLHRRKRTSDVWLDRGGDSLVFRHRRATPRGSFVIESRIRGRGAYVVVVRGENKRAIDQGQLRLGAVDVPRRAQELCRRVVRSVSS